MNDLTQHITEALAARRRQDQSTRSSHPDRAPPPGLKPPARHQAGQAQRFSIAPCGLDRDIQPWGVRPGIASVYRRGFEAVNSLGSSRPLWVVAIGMLCLGTVRVLAHLGVESNALVVHFMWPV